MNDISTVFVTGRTVIGFGLASFLLTSLAVVQEITHPRNRVAIAHSWDSYWILGSVGANFIVFGTSYLTTSWSWRIPYIIQVPLALYVLIAVQFMPETPRFLMSVGKEEEAMEFLVKYHGNGDREDPLVLFEFDEIKEAIKLEREARGTKWSTLLKSKGNIHRLGLAALMSFMTSLSGSSIFYYYCKLEMETRGSTGC
jgi:SP family sugar:H+ symporter-like MFS transporter